MPSDHRILIVDDEAGPREALRMMLKSRSDVMTASGGEQALELIYQTSPDVVFLDIKMKDMDGIEVLKAIKEIDASIEVVMMTAYASVETAREAVAFDASEYLIKPFSKAEVDKAVEKALAHRAERMRARDEIRLLLNQLRVLTQTTSDQAHDQFWAKNALPILRQSKQAMHATAALLEIREAVHELGKHASYAIPADVQQVIDVDAWHGLCNWVLKFAQPVRLPLPPQSPQPSTVLQSFAGDAYQTYLLFPIQAAHDIQGVMGFLYQDSDAIRPDWRELGQTFSDVMALTIQTHQRHHEAQRAASRQAQRAAQLGIVREMSGILMENLDLHDMLHDMGAQLEAGLGYAGIAIWLKEPDSRRPLLVYASEASDDLQDNMIGDALPTQLRVEQYDDVQVVVSPICIEQDTLGAIALRRETRDGGIAAFEIELIRMVLDALGVAVKNSQLYGEIKETKSYLENLINDAGDAIVTVDTAGTITSWNASAERIFGYRVDEMINENFSTIVPQHLYESCQQTVLSEGTVERVQTRLWQRNGAAIEASLTISPLHGARDDIIGFLAIIQDVTADKQMRERLMQSEKLRALGEMAAGVAHNFNNALTTILGHTQLLLSNPNTNAALNDGLNAIHQATKDAAQLVRRIQTFGQDRQPAVSSLIYLPQIARDVVEATRPVWTRPSDPFKAIDLHLHIDDVAPVVSHPAELREVLTNLILNAVDAMPNGGVMTIRTLQQDGLGCVCVEDTGCGMEEDVQRRIFDPFFSTKKGYGKGLGLSVSYTLIRSHGGDIEVDSVPGEGSRFWIKLPQA